MNEVKSDYEKALEKFLTEEHEAQDVLILWTKPGGNGHEVIVRGDILGLTGKMEYIIFAWRQNLFHQSMRQQRPVIITPHNTGRNQ